MANKGPLLDNLRKKCTAIVEMTNYESDERTLDLRERLNDIKLEIYNAYLLVDLLESDGC
jgi:hypothetical protein